MITAATHSSMMQGTIQERSENALGPHVVSMCSFIPFRSYVGLDSELSMVHVYSLYKPAVDCQVTADAVTIQCRANSGELRQVSKKLTADTEHKSRLHRYIAPLLETLTVQIPCFCGVRMQSCKS
jgi:hypothetical protein